MCTAKGLCVVKGASSPQPPHYQMSLAFLSHMYVIQHAHRMPGLFCDVMMMCGHHLGRSSESPPTSAHPRTFTHHLTTGVKYSAVIVTLWTTCSFSHGQVMYPVS